MSEALGKLIGVVLLAFLAGVAIALLLAFPIMWMWNYVCPVVFGLPEITAWQAFWLMVLIHWLWPSGNTQWKTS